MCVVSSTTAISEAFAPSRALFFAGTEGFELRECHEPFSQPSPVATLTTERVRSTSAPFSRGSVLVAVPRQTAFVILSVAPPAPVQVRVDVLVAVAENVAPTSEVAGGVGD